jgi:hypothetical protein
MRAGASFTAPAQGRGGGERGADRVAAYPPLEREPPSNRPRPRRRPRMRPPLPPANGLALHWRADGLGRRSPRPRARTRSRHRRIRVSARVRVRDGAASSTRGRPPRNHPKNPPNPVLFPALLTSCLMTPALHPFPISAFSFQLFLPSPRTRSRRAEEFAYVHGYAYSCPSTTRPSTRGSLPPRQPSQESNKS